MIPKDCKCPAEVDFPISVVSKHTAREESIRQLHVAVGATRPAP